MKYCSDILQYQRRKTREVRIGDVGVGGDNPIRIQSMTISDTMDTPATVAETIQLVEAGCEIVRITAPSIKEAENLKNIKSELLARGVSVPLVADIHFTPNAALIAADYVEKVRINPGNYADKKRFEQREYTDDEYSRELERIEQRFKPLVLKCKSLGRAMRIGTNHGSLSDRIMNRYGDTAEGMVESALEFVHICQKHDYHDLILSMKSSNPLVAIQAYRLLAARMDELGMDYPFHLGVTEAGDGMEGRVKSAVGIGGLLEDGIGDTIRVSLTEDAVKEVPVAFCLAEKFNRSPGFEASPRQDTRTARRDYISSPDPFEYNRRPTLEVDHVYYGLGGDNPPRVELSLTSAVENTRVALTEMAATLGRPLNGALNLISENGRKHDNPVEVVHICVDSHEKLGALRTLRESAAEQGLHVPLAVHVPLNGAWAEACAQYAERLVVSPDLSEPEKLNEVIAAAGRHGCTLELRLAPDASCMAPGKREFSAIDESVRMVLRMCEGADFWNVMFSLSPDFGRFSIVHAYRFLAGRLDALQANLPIALCYRTGNDADDAMLQAASQIGALLCDGIGDSIHLESPLPAKQLLALSYTILQATRLRISRTDYISCPSCGRTLFNLQTTTERIKSKTDHLKGVKIAIMGCIVNGPGEMADADFGYVGAGPKKVNLFVGKECVQRNIPEAEADERLISLIKQHGRWVERN